MLRRHVLACLLCLAVAMPTAVVAQDPLDEKIQVTTAAATPMAAPNAVPPLGFTLDPATPEVGKQAYLVLPEQQGAPFDALALKVPPGASPGVRLGQPESTAPGRWRIPVRFLHDGELEVPSLTLEATRASTGEARTFVTPPQSVTVAAPAQPQPDAQTDYTDLAQAPPTLWRYYVVGALAAVGAALVAWLLWRLIRRLAKRHAVAAAARPAEAPIAEALRSLRDLSSLDVYRTAGSKAHYLELSLLVRRYIERQWRLNAMEWTEEEAAEKLARGSSHTSAAAPELLGVFENASLAKYAKGEIDEAVVRADLEAARAFLGREESRLSVAARAAANSSPRREAA